MSILSNEQKRILKERKAIDLNNEVAKEIKRQELFDTMPDDEDKIIELLNSCNSDELYYITEIFEDIYRKFTTDKMWDALEKLES